MDYSLQKIGKTELFPLIKDYSQKVHYTKNFEVRSIFDTTLLNATDYPYFVEVIRDQFGFILPDQFSLIDNVFNNIITGKETPLYFSIAKQTNQNLLRPSSCYEPITSVKQTLSGSLNTKITVSDTPSQNVYLEPSGHTIFFHGTKEDPKVSGGLVTLDDSNQKETWYYPYDPVPGVTSQTFNLKKIKMDFSKIALKPPTYPYNLEYNSEIDTTGSISVSNTFVYNNLRLSTDIEVDNYPCWCGIYMKLK